MMQTSHARHESQSVVIVPAATYVPVAQRVTAVPLDTSRTDMHTSVYKIAVLCWAMLLAVFWITFFVSSHALFMVAIGTIYATVFFGVPFILSRTRPSQSVAPPTLGAFARGRFDTLYGPIGGFDAMLQVFLVPLLLSVGGVAIGLIIHAARIAH